MHTNSPSLWKIPPLLLEGHKYTRGHVLVYGGPVMTGASRLTALAALRIGAGIVTLAADEKTWPIYAESLLSVITRPLTTMQDWQALLADARINVVVIGPGAGVNDSTKQAMRAALLANKKCVFDADAITLLAQDASLRDAVKGRDVILTPHEGEYAKLASALRLADGDKASRAQALAEAMGVVVLLKGHETIIASTSTVVANDHAPEWLATAGSGDVLAGMIAGLWAQGMSAFDAACAGTWLHGEAAYKLSRGMMAEDLLGKIPEVFARND
ncbi:MAG: NAD(P)H-hydrate dehydratase [Rickettsiales bacterium]